MKEFTEANAKVEKSCSDPNSNAQRTLCLLKSVLGENVYHPQIILLPPPFGFLEFLPLVAPCHSVINLCRKMP